MREINVVINGSDVQATVSDRLLLSDFIRDDQRLTGTHVGCEHGYCGSCTVLLDGASVRSCLTLAVQTDGHGIETVELLPSAPNSIRFRRPSDPITAFNAGSVHQAC